jgi:hypothetical protein
MKGLANIDIIYFTGGLVGGRWAIIKGYRL